MIVVPSEIKVILFSISVLKIFMFEFFNFNNVFLLGCPYILSFPTLITAYSGLTLDKK